MNFFKEIGVISNLQEMYELEEIIKWCHKETFNQVQSVTFYKKYWPNLFKNPVSWEKIR